MKNISELPISHRTDTCAFSSSAFFVIVMKTSSSKVGLSWMSRIPKIGALFCAANAINQLFNEQRSLKRLLTFRWVSKKGKRSSTSCGTFQWIWSHDISTAKFGTV